MTLSAIILVPEGFDSHTEAHYPLAIFHDHFVDDFDDFRIEPPDPNLKPDYSERFHISGYNRIQQEEAYKFYRQWSGPTFRLAHRQDSARESLLRRFLRCKFS